VYKAIHTFEDLYTQEGFTDTRIVKGIHGTLSDLEFVTRQIGRLSECITTRIPKV